MGRTDYCHVSIVETKLVCVNCLISGGFTVVHQWVGAALVGMGKGDSLRAEHASRTGRHVLPAATKIEVLEVYCRRCRVQYEDRLVTVPCDGAGAVRVA
jgi:hypothetical protein